jgi:NTE family protein
MLCIIRDAAGGRARCERTRRRRLVFFAPVHATRAGAPRRWVLSLILSAQWLAASGITHAQALRMPAPRTPSQPTSAQPTTSAEPAATPTTGARRGAPAGAHPVAAPGAAAETARRPRIGLVLSGGGARGAAHIGVLKVLEELHVPLAAIAGTSMGAVVGGLYASGLSARDIEKIMTSINWQDAFRDRPPREDLDLRRKEEDETFLVKYRLGVRDGQVVLPKGLIQGQRLTQTLRRLTLPVARISNFDELPTPFRAVATDLETGDGVVMTSGDLTTAMRASLSAPGFFAPVERDGRLLVDGGIADNIPVDIARSMGVDRVIVVDVSSPLLPGQQLTSFPVISNQMVQILIRQNSQAQLASLSPQDILIQPALGDASSFDFGIVARVIAAGESAALGRRDQLAALAVSEPDMQRYLAHRETRRSPPPQIDFVQVDPGAGRYGPPAEKLFGDLVGQPLDADTAARRVSELYGRGGLDTLDYRLVGEPSRYGLAIDARPSSLGTNYLRFGLSLQDDFEGHATYDAAVRFVMSDITRNAGEWVSDLKIGSTTGISTELFLPLQPYAGWFVMPHLADEAHDLYVLEGQSVLAQYRVHTFDYGVDFGYQFSNWGEVRVGVLREQGHYVLSIGDATDPNLPVQSFTPFDNRDYFVRLTYDRLDDINFPHRGQQATIQYSADRNPTGLGQNADQVTASYLGAYSWGRDTLSFSANGGVTLQADITNINLLFPLGGFLNLSALRPYSLLGPNFGIARLLYYRQIGRAGPGYFDVPTYLGVSFEAGNVWQSRSEASFGNTQKNASVFLGMDTPLGPVYLATGFDTHGHQAFYLFLGRTF